MRRPLLISLAIIVPIVALALVSSKATTFTLKDPKSVNQILFTLDGRLEQFGGSTRGITGDFTFDPDNIEATRGTIVVDATSLVGTHPGMTDHILGGLWLDTKKYPTIEFKVTKVERVRKLDTEDASWSMSVTGDFSMHGVTKSMTIPVRLTHFPGQLGKRNRGAKGDLIVLRSEFEIKRSDFGIDGRLPIDTVSNVVEVKFSMGAFARTPTE